MRLIRGIKFIDNSTLFLLFFSSPFSFPVFIFVFLLCFLFSILLRFTEDEFSENMRNTVGMDYKTKYITFDDGIVKLAIWVSYTINIGLLYLQYRTETIITYTLYKVLIVLIECLSCVYRTLLGKNDFVL